MDDAAALAARVAELGERVDALADGELRAAVDALAAAIADLYGEGLTRIFAALPDAERERLAQDGVVASLMLMHGLYPVALEQRVAEALEEVRPYLASHGGDVELVELGGDDVLRLRLVGSCDGCAASASTLELAIEEALAAAAPDLAGVEVAGVVERPRADAAHPPEGTRWIALERAGDIGRGTFVVAGPLLVANVAGTLLAYRDACTACGAVLHEGLLIGGTLTCPGCGRGFDLPRAGRCRDPDGPQLMPAPLLRGGGQVKVAMPAAHDRDSTCGLCGITIRDDHRHLLELTERRMVCVCETCWSVRSGDAEFRPAGGRQIVLDGFDLPDELWAAFEIPVALAFLLRSSGTGGMAALYPSPAGATEASIDPGAWARLVERNPVLARLEPDAEALLIDRVSATPRVVIAPIDACYRLVGMIKQRWTGISGGDAIGEALDAFFADLDATAVAA